MRWIYIGCAAILLFCMALLGGCAAGSEYEYKTEELYAERDGSQIYGVIYIPQEAGQQMPAAIFSHGFGGTIRLEHNMPKPWPRRAMLFIALISVGAVQKA